MSSTPLQLTLFSFYPGGPKIRLPVRNDVDRAFRLRDKALSPGYAVNIPPTTIPNSSFAIENGRLVQNTSESVNLQNFQLDGVTLRRASTPETAPEIPEKYQRQASFFTINESNYDTLVSQPEFRIPGIGLGLKVTTDGLGGIDSVAIDPSSRGVLSVPSAIADDFGGLNRAEISSRAMFFHAAPPFGPVSDTPPASSSASGGSALPPPPIAGGVLQTLLQFLFPPLATPLAGPKSSPTELSAGRPGFPVPEAQNPFGLFPFSPAISDSAFSLRLPEAETAPPEPETSKLLPNASESAFASLLSGNVPQALPHLPAIDRVMDGRIPLFPPAAQTPAPAGAFWPTNNAFQTGSALGDPFFAWQPPGPQDFFRMEAGLQQQSGQSPRGGFGGNPQSNQEQSPFRPRSGWRSPR